MSEFYFRQLKKMGFVQATDDPCLYVADWQYLDWTSHSQKIS